MLEPLIPAAPTHRGGRPREVARGAVVQTSLSLTRRGGQGERLPHEWLPKSTVDDYGARWRDDGTWAKRRELWRAQSRGHAGREPTPSAAGSDRPAVKTTAMGGAERGEEGGPRVKGRQRPLVGETLGVWLAVWSTGAGLDAGVAAPLRLQPSEPHAVPRLETLCAAHPSPQHALHAWMEAPRPTWHIAVKTRPAGSTGGTPLAKRGVVARTTAWHGRSRRHRTDDERQPASSTAMLSLRHSHLMLRRRTSHRRPEFPDRKVAAEPLKFVS